MRVLHCFMQVETLQGVFYVLIKIYINPDLNFLGLIIGLKGIDH